VTAEEVARAYLAAFAIGDPDAVARHVSAGFVNDHASALGVGCVGREEYRRRLPGFLASLPGLSYEVESLIVDGGDVAARYRLRATSDGHPIDIRGVMVMQITAGEITHRTDYWDSLTFLRQTGQAE
jgi:ketosteroid isomerase-like protein